MGFRGARVWQALEFKVTPVPPPASLPSRAAGMGADAQFTGMTQGGGEGRAAGEERRALSSRDVGKSGATCLRRKGGGVACGYAEGALTVLLV